MEYNNIDELDDITVADGYWTINDKKYYRSKLPDSVRKHVNEVLSKFKDDYFKLELCYLKEYDYDVIITRKIDTAEWNDKEFNTLEFGEDLEKHLHSNDMNFE